MDFTPSSLFASMIIGAVGLGLFLYGKKQQRIPQLVAGIALSIFPFFIGSVGWMIGIAVGVVAALWCAVRAGF